MLNFKSLFLPSTQEDKFDRVCFNCIIFDVFFLPLFPWFSASISLPMLFVWYLKNSHKTRFIRERSFFGVIILLMFISTLICPLYEGGSKYDTTFFYSVKTLFMYLTSFWYYFFFTYFFFKYNRRITDIVYYSIIWITILGVFSYIYKDYFIVFKQIVCPFDPQPQRWLSGSELVFRYNYFWADPNNVAYAVSGLSLFYLIEQPINNYKKIVVLISIVITLFFTMSLGGIAVSCALYVLVILFAKKMSFSGNSRFVVIVICMCLIYFIVNNFTIIQEMYDSGIATRLDSYDSYGGVKAAGGRLKDLYSGIEKFNILFLLVGCGQEGFVTEIGHIYLLYLYGLPVYIYFMYVLFFKKKINYTDYVVLIPYFVGFSINISIIEQKFLLLNMVISAYYSAKVYRLNLFQGARICN